MNFYARSVLLLAVLNAFGGMSTHAMEQAMPQVPSSTQERLPVPPWIEHSQTARACLLLDATDDTTSINFSSDAIQDTLQGFRAPNPYAYDLVSTLFSLPPEELGNRLATHDLNSLYTCLDFTALVELKNDFASRLAAHFVERLYSHLQENPQDTLAFLAQAKRNSPNRLALHQINRLLDNVWLSLEAPLILPHANVINTARFNQDSSCIFTAARDNKIRVWDAHTGKLLNTVTCHDHFTYDHYYIFSAHFNSDCSRIVTTHGDNAAYVTDTKTGTLIRTLVGHTNTVFSAQFNHHGTAIITQAHDHTLRIWGADTGALIHTLNAKDIIHAQFSHDDSSIFTVSRNGTICIWSAQTGILINTMHIHADFAHRSIVRAQLNHDESRLITAFWGDTTAHTWDVNTGTLLHALSTPRAWELSALMLHIFTGHVINSIEFNHDGSRIVTISWLNNTAHIWDAHTGRLLHTLSLPPNAGSPATFNNQGSHILTAGGSALVVVWRVKPPTCTLAQALLIKAITQAPQTSTFDFRSAQNQRLLPLFKTLDPAWQNAIVPLVQLPLSEQIARACTLRNLAIGGTTAATTTLIGYGLWKYGHGQNK